MRRRPSSLAVTVAASACGTKPGVPAADSLINLGAIASRSAAGFRPGRCPAASGRWWSSLRHSGIGVNPGLLRSAYLLRGSPEAPDAVPDESPSTVPGGTVPGGTVAGAIAVPAAKNTARPGFRGRMPSWNAIPTTPAARRRAASSRIRRIACSRAS